ncbi:MAG: hypothetical protein VX083_03825 [Pseudomonadota bacterium]|uniref:hypothetical protein n=1 Tax=Thalassovita sp. TaxID=1979401 RepID=UPI002AAFA268|nr:hypothetical protein [Thalassovita sp.]MEC8041514.1 hypothetical protein [Pseudomonadota bacterium]MEC8292606.1 hypothetical protein [Pseudomonadota bacterium]
MTQKDTAEDIQTPEDLAQSYLTFATDISRQLLAATERQNAAQHAQMQDVAQWCQAILSGQPIGGADSAD